MLIFFTVAYFPDWNLVHNVESAYLAGLKIYIYNNGISDDIIHALSKFPVHLLGTGQNDGLGIAFATFEDSCLTRNDFYIYLDQDSSLELEDWRFIASNYLRHFHSRNVGMLHISGNRPRLSIFTSSGSIFSGAIIRDYVKHDPSFFVEGLDYSYCYDIFRENLIVDSFRLKSFDHLTHQDGVTVHVLGKPFVFRTYSNRRVLDFFCAHLRLMFRCALSFHLHYLLYFTRSLILWNIKNIASYAYFWSTSCWFSFVSKAP